MPRIYVKLTHCPLCGLEKEVPGKRCKPCKRAQEKRWRASHPEQMRAIKSREYNKNKTKYLADMAAYAKAHPEINKKACAKWRSQNNHKRVITTRNRRARLAGAIGSFTRSEWDAIKLKQRGRCAICGLKKKLTIDHIIPVSRGGSNMAVNIQGLCLSCNSRKNASLPDDVVQPSIFDKLDDAA